MAFGWGVWIPGAEVVPKSPMMSSTVDFCCCAGRGGDVVNTADEEPNISARRSWFDWADAAGWGAEPTVGVDKTSSPRRSALDLRKIRTRLDELRQEDALLCLSWNPQAYFH